MDQVPELSLGWGVAGAIALVLILWLVAARASSMRRRWRTKQRGLRAVAGERQAEKLLRRRGYELIGAQVPTEWDVRVDGKPITVGLRADLLVRRGRKAYVAEVKTGREAPSIEWAATRRQLLEYRLAYDVDGVLLVDVEAGGVSEVEFALSAGAQSLRRDR